MLEWFGSADCVTPLAAQLWDDNPAVRDAARRALAANPAPAAARALREGLASTTADQQAAYIEALAYHGDPRSSRVIVPYLQSDDLQVVNSAARALGKLNDRGAYRSLVAARKRGPATIRPAIEVAMLDLGLSRSDARALVTDGSTPAIRVAAFRPSAHRPRQATGPGNTETDPREQ